ncbi:WAT1-related protein [Cinnamomum micranthum f. kanehirae]|uniref:WAT1-related protein n=1 Tax=Cinnamomum micranthum f. kanehirae TaxID=337451 RepID=A0A443PUR8_9MAGN|nr:WAT1-related protein [Cinnamomum micranthum f. kanehirae]
MADTFMPILAMVIVQLIFAGMNVVSKLAMNSGLNPFVMTAYRQIVAVVFSGPFAYFWERNTRPKITRTVLFQLFLSSLFGVTMNQCFYFLGLKLTTPTIAVALGNLLPAITFIMAVLFRLEKVDIKRLADQAKIVGTLLCVGGAMFMTFYKGILIKMPESSIHWRYVENLAHKSSDGKTNIILGSALVIGGSLGWSIWFIVQVKISVNISSVLHFTKPEFSFYHKLNMIAINQIALIPIAAEKLIMVMGMAPPTPNGSQAKMGKSFNSPYTSSAIMYFMGWIECLIVAACVERDISQWALGWNIRLIAVTYSGFFCSAIGLSLMNWSIQKKGPLFVSLFNPLMLIIVAIIGWAILEERLHVGSVAGSVVIIVGLYTVLWGKGKDINKITSAKERILEEEHERGGGSELPLYGTAMQQSNGYKEGPKG